ncbi:Serine/threonine protein kinase [Streptomyces sp. DvalAA-14]|uniref:serine/threonine-protein kinase n=1 Tax=unclassified Streptomyces TaxID=2593676 RepID=UPI00081B9F03|nr:MULTISPECIES: serine/threonine-protein kinase [unclassified Streptomyces]MYS25027.1 protein kinase [Streptomyces sp. SID4948]SCE51497.1 Serine/threonine protein kinase [Streptomyces sp. DvalAA-14]
MVGQGDEGRLVAGRYRLVERIGRGGMGTVWRAEDELLGRQVAVKKLHPPQPHMDDDELATLFERTRREARAAARISHPNVIVVHDVVDDEGLPSIVMEYVPSVTLGERLKERGPLPVPEVARIGRGMIAALRAAHRAGVLHRDVKPGNVLLGVGGGDGDGGGDGGGRVVLTDFGIAQASGTSTLTRTGELIGSIDFLSPERIRGAMPGPEADMWALGATLHQAVEGISPFRRPTAIETAYAIAEEPVAEAPNAGPLTRVISGLLAKDPAERLTAEQAERLLRMPIPEADTALVGQFVQRDEQPPGASVVRRPGAIPEPIPEAAPVSAVGGYGPHTPLPAQQSASAPVQRQQQPYSPPPGRRKGRAAPLVAAALAVLVLAGGGTLLALHQRHAHTDAKPDTDTPSAPSTASTAASSAAPTATPTTAPAAPPASATTVPAPPPLPDGYRLFTDDGRGYSLPVPEDWTKQVSSGGEEVDFIDPTQKVDLKISSLDFASNSPYQHFQNLEPATEAEVDGYHRKRLDPTTRLGDPAAIWEFTFEGSVREYHAIDLGFGQPGATEYAVYVSAPDAQWAKYRKVFDAAVAGFRQSG